VIYNFIDTPGLNDTRSYQQDEVNLDKILTTARDTSDLVSIMLIVNGTQSRLTPAMMNIVVTLKGSLPDSCMDNFIVVLSKTDKRKTQFQRSSLATIAPNIKKDFIFYMDNTAFATKPLKDRKFKSRQQEDEIKEAMEREWRKSMKTCTKITDLVSSLNSVSVKDFEKTMRHRQKIKSLLHQVKLKMKSLQDMLENLSVAEQRVRDLDQDQEKFRNYTKTEQVKRIIPQPTPYHNTICSRCDHVCHQYCGLEEMTSTGSNHFLNCEAMNKTNNCTHCPGKCSHTDHYHAKHIFVEEERTVEKVLEDMKAQYDDAVREHQHVSLEIDNYNNSLQSLDQTMQAIVDKLNRTCNKLKLLCTGFNFADELRVTYRQLQMEAKKQRTIVAQQAMKTSLDVLEKLINFHSAQNGSIQDAHLMRPDLDDHDDSSDDDDDNERPQQKRNQRHKSRRGKKGDAQTKFPEKSKSSVSDAAAANDEDEWDDIEANFDFLSLKPKKTPNDQYGDRTSDRPKTAQGKKHYRNNDADVPEGPGERNCVECKRRFMVTQGDYNYYIVKLKGYLPKRCHSCRDKNKQQKK